MNPNPDPTYPSGSMPNYPQAGSMPYGYSYPYPQPGGYYAGPMAPTTNGLATASLVCSLMGLFLVPVIGSVLAIIFGSIALVQLKESYGRQEGRGLAIAGIVVGALGLLICACIVIAVVAALSDPTFQQSIQ